MNVSTENKGELGEEDPSLLIRRNGKTLYAVAYRNPLPRIRYILAKDYKDALLQVMKTRQSLGEVDSVGPAIGAYTKAEERKRLYCFGDRGRAEDGPPRAPQEK